MRDSKLPVSWGTVFREYLQEPLGQRRLVEVAEWRARLLEDRGEPGLDRREPSPVMSELLRGLLGRGQVRQGP